MFLFVVLSGEKEKFFENFYVVYMLVFENKLDRNFLIFVFGGGMIGDLVGFVVVLFMCGICFV